jgi:hypothetical protein
MPALQLDFTYVKSESAKIDRGPQAGGRACGLAATRNQRMASQRHASSTAIEEAATQRMPVELA